VTSVKPSTCALALLCTFLSEHAARAEPPAVFPWVDPGDVPLQAGTQTVRPNRADVAIVQAPGETDKRRGTFMLDARSLLFGARRAPHCGGRWFEIGPMSWVCSDDVTLSSEPPVLGLALLPLTDGLPYRYYFVGPEGAEAYGTLQYAGEESPERQLEKGWSVPVVEQRPKDGNNWGRTRSGLWVEMASLSAARSFAFQGEALTHGLDAAWVVADRISVYSEPAAQKKTSEVRVRFQSLRILEEKPTKEGMFLQVRGPGDAKNYWVRAKDVARQSPAEPPAEVTGSAQGERWVDIELASQTLVAYEGTKPVFSTIVSTGRGAQGTDSATPRGVHRIWVKLFTSPMDNLEKEDADRYYSIEDVPWVQFFDKGVALHAAFWHRDFGRVRSHGCVNLAPIDAHWLFQWTGPHMPSGWEAVLPTPLDAGTWVRIR
jgi:lipoprotein-anchoring transpeptidase ErfK/SrfK